MTGEVLSRLPRRCGCSFLDGSVRRIGLKQLWTLKWHRNFNTANHWTRAGGAEPDQWPEWMRPLKDF